MITLTTPPQVNSVLGGNTPVGYDKFVLSQIVFDTVALSLTATIRLTSTATPSMQPITGNLRVVTATATLTIDVAQLDFYRQVTLSGPQNASVQAQIRSAQDALESGLITLGVIAGVQAMGA